MNDIYTPPGRSLRECKYWWFDIWDWLVNHNLQFFSNPVIKPAPGEIAIDPHLHTLFSHCSISRPDLIILRAAQIGLGGIGISDHNECRGIAEARKCAEYLKAKRAIPEDFLIIPGVEINSKNGHICALFFEDIIPKGLSPEETVGLIHEAGGLAIAPHPYHSTGIGDAIFDAPFDAVEIQCGSVFNSKQVKQNRDLASDNRMANVAKIGSSDAHYLRAIASCYTTVKTTEHTLEAVKEAIKRGDTQPESSQPYIRLQKMLGKLSKLS